MKDDFETSADGVPTSFSLGQHHRAAVKICATLFHLLYSLSSSFLVGDVGGAFLLPCEMLIPLLCNSHPCTCLQGRTL